MTIDEIYAIAPNDLGWRQLPNGKSIMIGKWCEIGAGSDLGDYANRERRDLRRAGSD